jgi:hypothetical protein
VSAEVEPRPRCSTRKRTLTSCCDAEVRGGSCAVTPRGYSDLKRRAIPVLFRVYLTFNSSTSNTSQALGGMVPRTPSRPYAMPGGMTSFRLSPTRIPFTPTSQPLITSPTPSRNSNGPLPLVESNTWCGATQSDGRRIQEHIQTTQPRQSEKSEQRSSRGDERGESAPTLLLLLSRPSYFITTRLPGVASFPLALPSETVCT